MSDPATGGAGEFEFRAEMRQLLHLIVHSLYTNQEIFLRELISNASDALNKARFRQLTDRSPDAKGAEDLEIRVTVDSDANTITVEDTGIGMRRSDLVDRLGTVASSGTLEFLEQMKESGKPLDGSMIGRFGVGFYSCFMVASQVEIETRYADSDAQPLRWTSDGTGTFTIEDGSRPRQGTSVTLHLKEDAKDFATEFRVRGIIRKYSNFVDFPIRLGAEQVNTIKALWTKRKEDLSDEERNEFYKFVAGDYEDPMGHLHMQVEGVLKFDALLFVPARAPATFFQDESQKNLHLYSSGVFIRDDAEDLLPDYLRFVRGVLDTDDLPLNVSREVTQNSPVVAKIRSTLTNKLLGLLQEWAQEGGDRYDRFYAEFGHILKVGLWSDFSRQEELLSLLRYASTHTEADATTTLAAYVERMSDGQEAIYYLLADSLESARTSPHLEGFRRHGLEVLLMVDSVDPFTITNVTEYDGKPLKSATSPDLELGEDEESDLPGADTDALLALFRVQLGDRVKDVTASKRLVDSAAALVADAEGQDPQLERIRRAYDPKFEGFKKVLELNAGHPLMKNILTLQKNGGNDELVESLVEQVHDAARLMEGKLTEPAEFVSRLTRFMVAASAVSEEGTSAG